MAFTPCIGPEATSKPELDTVQDFFNQVGHKTMYAFIGNKHLFSLNHVIARRTKIMNNLLKVFAKFVLTFKVILWHQKFKQFFLIFFSLKNI